MKPGSVAEERPIALLVAVLSLSIAIGIVSALFHSPVHLLGAVLFFTLMVVLSLKQDWAIYTLLLASFCSAITLEAGPVTLRPDQIVAIAIAPPLLLLLISGSRPLIKTGLESLIIVYLFCNVFSSLLNSPDKAMSFQKCALLGVTSLGFFITTHLIDSRRLLNRVLVMFVVVGVLEALYSILSVLLLQKGINIGGTHAPYGDMYARGTFLEGNLFGSFQMMIALMLISFLFCRPLVEYRALILISLFTVLVALVVSYTRAAWIAFMIGLTTYVFLFQRHLILRYIRHVPLILIGCMLIAVLAYGFAMSRQSGSANLMDVYANRLTKIIDYKSETSSMRLRVWVGSILFWSKNPFFGNGTDSIKVLATGTSLPEFGEGYWIPNSMLLALHDTGLVGLTVFLAIQLVFLRHVWRAIRRTSYPFYRSVLEGFFVAFIGAHFTYLFTNGFWLIFIWVFMGIGMCCVRFASGPSPLKEMGQSNADRD
jgi:hypothetical protein